LVSRVIIADTELPGYVRGFVSIAADDGYKLGLLAAREGGQNGAAGDGTQANYGEADLFRCDHCLGVSYIYNFLTFAIRAAELLIADGFVIEATQFFAVIENFVDGVGDRFGIFGAAEEKIMRKPDRFVIGGALGFGT
jgi:hypothetical protein